MSIYNGWEYSQYLDQYKRVQTQLKMIKGPDMSSLIQHLFIRKIKEIVYGIKKDLQNDLKQKSLMEKSFDGHTELFIEFLSGIVEYNRLLLEGSDLVEDTYLQIIEACGYKFPQANGGFI